MSILSSLIARFSRWQEERAEAYLLRTMSDRGLADIGLTRGDVDQVLNGAYEDPRDAIFAARAEARARRDVKVDQMPQRLAA
ncbi:DUF1127 domain-containing protein [Novispirillum itersonii]|uniref:DUF1127 domain-containing protein n=1 Tax=Novispirillum itersonii TaxID=189 RepID=UPI0003814453|nr:DUF1127 domain-containing protein [Novispirillum itersonii]